MTIAERAAECVQVIGDRETADFVRRRIIDHMTVARTEGAREAEQAMKERCMGAATAVSAALRQNGRPEPAYGADVVRVTISALE